MDPEALQLLADSLRPTMTISRPRAPSSTRHWPTSAGSTCSTKSQILQFLWCSGCSARPARTPRAQRRRAARRRACGRRYRAAAVRGRLLGGLGAQRRFQFGARQRAADTPCARRRSAALAALAAGRRAVGLVAGRHQPGDACTGAPARAGSCSIRPAHRLVPGDPAPAGRDARRHRRRRGDPAGRRCSQNRTSWPACWPRPRPARRR